ncbi:unnamed protein product [Brassica rapa subsp. narinosa]
MLEACNPTEAGMFIGRERLIIGEQNKLQNFASQHSDVLENLSPTVMDHDHHDEMESRRGSGRSLVSEVVSTFVYKGMEIIFYLLSYLIYQLELIKKLRLRDVKDKNTLLYVHSQPLRLRIVKL